MKTSLGTPVRHLLVDLDGTLLGNRALPLSLDFVNRSIGLLKKYGGMKKAVTVLYDIWREFGRSGKDSTGNAITNDKRVIELFSKRMNLSIEEGREVLRDGVLNLFPTLQKHFYPIPGSKEFLDWASKHYPLTLATNPVWPKEIAELRVKWAGIDPKLFGFVTHVREMSSVKPNPDYFREILSKLSLKPEDCLLIGDSEKMDLPATLTGIRVFIVDNDRRRKTKTLRSGARVLRRIKGNTIAWKGSFEDLMKLLDEQRIDLTNKTDS